MAKKIKKEDGEEQKPNIENLEKLANEFNTGRMVPKKIAALIRRLVELYKGELATEDEKELMIEMLTTQRAQGLLPSGGVDHYLLNEIESAACAHQAECITDNAIGAHHLKKGLICRFSLDPKFNDRKGKKDSVGRYYVYVPRTVPTEHQIPQDVAYRRLERQPIEPHEYPKERVLIHRLILKVPEFKRMFEVIEEDILNAAAKEAEPEYTF